MNSVHKIRRCGAAVFSALLLISGTAGCSLSPREESASTEDTAVTTTTSTIATTTTSALTTTTTTTSATTTTTTTVTSTTTTATKPTTTTSATATAPITTTTVSTAKPVDATTAPPSTAQGKDALDKIIKSAVSAYGGVGIQVAVISDGKVSHTAQYGWAEKNVRPMQEDTLLRIASPSKTIVSMIVHRLIDEGKLSLEDDISKHLGVTVRNPQYPNTPITVKMLLSHTSGLRDAEYLPTLEALQKHLTSNAAFTSARPGANFVYNNFAIGVLGTVCECAAGKSFTALAEEYFFKPMGITASFLAERVPREQLAVIYYSSGAVGLSIDQHLKLATYNENPGHTMRCYAGGLIISAADFARLLTVLMNDGEYEGQQLLSSSSVSSMHQVQFERGNSIQQCLPMWRRDGMYNQTPVYFHTGSAYGIYSLYAYNPQARTGVVVITSGSSAARDSDQVYAVCGQIARAVYQQSETFFNKSFV